MIKTLSSTEDLANISRFVQNGDVCEVSGKLYVNENGVATEIKLSKEKFEELFPPLTSVSFEQCGLGDCWLVTTLDNFMDLPLGRASMYKLFEQQGNDVLIKFPNGTNSIRFENGEVLDAGSKQIVSASYKEGNSSSKTPIGIQMVEQAFAIHRYRKYDTGALTTEISAYSTNVEALMKELTGGWQYEATREILGTDTTVDSYGINLQNREQMKEYIKQFANDENVLTFFNTRDIKGGHETALMGKYDLYGNHAYSIKGYDETTGMVYITNPWHTSVVTEVPLYELMKYMDDVNFAYLKQEDIPEVEIIAVTPAP